MSISTYHLQRDQRLFKRNELNFDDIDFRDLNFRIALQHGEGIIYNDRSVFNETLREKDVGYSATLQNALQNGIDSTIIGTNRALDSLTALVLDQVIRQQFYDLGVDHVTKEKRKLSDMLNIRVGGVDKTWANTVQVTKSVLSSDGTGGWLVDSGLHTVSQSSAHVTSQDVPVMTWAKKSTSTIFQIEQSVQARNFDLLVEYEMARKQEWDRYVMLEGTCIGNKYGLNGLLNQPNITADQALLTKPFKAMSLSETHDFLANFMKAWFDNNSAMLTPDSMWIDLEDYSGLGGPHSDQFPMKTRLQVIEEGMSMATNSNFKIFPISYCNKKFSKLPKNRYVLYRREDDTLDRRVLIDYTTVLASQTQLGLENTSYSYGRCTGVNVFRPQNVLYLDYNI